MQCMKTPRHKCWCSKCLPGQIEASKVIAALKKSKTDACRTKEQKFAAKLIRSHKRISAGQKVNKAKYVNSIKRLKRV